jgi:hypothetical protein
MKTTVRDAAYETNSSSAHSLTMAEGDIFDRTFAQSELRSGLLCLQYPTVDYPGFSVYGLDWFRYYKPENILLYLLTQAAGGRIVEEGDLGSLVKHLAADSSRVRDFLAVVRSETKCDVVFDGDSWTDFGDLVIDHESLGLGLDVLTDPGKLRHLLFGRESYVQTGGDLPPLYINTDSGPKFYAPELLSEGEGLAHWAEIEIVDNDVITYLDDEGLQLTNGLNGFDVFDVFGCKAIRAHVTGFEVSFAHYVSAIPEEFRLLEDELDRDPQARANNMMSAFLHMVTKRYRLKRKDGVRNLTLSDGFLPSFTEVGESHQSATRLNDCSTIKMKFHLDAATRDIMRSFVGEYERDLRV